MIRVESFNNINNSNCNSKKYKPSFGLSYSKTFCEFLKKADSLTESQTSIALAQESIKRLAKLSSRQDGLILDIPGYSKIKTVFDNMKFITITNGKYSDNNIGERIIDFAFAHSPKLGNYKRFLAKKGNTLDAKERFYHDNENSPSGFISNMCDYFESPEALKITEDKFKQMAEQNVLAEVKPSRFKRLKKDIKELYEYGFDYFDWANRRTEEKIKAMANLKTFVTEQLG